MINAVAEAYLARQAATLGRRAKPAVDPPWVPCLPGLTEKCLGVLRGTGAEANGGQATSVAIFPKGRALVTGSPDGRLRRWSLETGTIIWEGSERHGNRINDVAVSPDGRRLATASYDNTLRIWNADNGWCFSRCQRHRSLTYQVKWAADSCRLAAAAADDTVRIWDSTKGKSLLCCRGHQEMVWSVAWSPDARYLASGSADHTVRIWSVSSGNCIRQLQGHTDWVVTATWSPQGHYLASLGNDHTIRVWDTLSWKMIRCWSVHAAARYLKDLVWSPDGRLLASAARDRVISVWEPSTGRELARFAFPEDSAWRLAWSPNGAFLVSSHSGDIFRVWDTRELMTVAATALSSPPGRFAHGLVELSAALAQLHRLQLYPPLSLLHELLRLLSGHTSTLAKLAEHPNIRRLIALKWPTTACVGLAALLLRPLSSPAWKPPPDLSPGMLCERLNAVLAEEPIEPKAPAPPLAALIEVANSIDERLLNLLAILGPEAVAAEPGLPLRLLHRIPELPCLSVPQRRLLGLRLPLQRNGRAHGHGMGSEWAGLALRGDLRTLLPSQLVLPRPMLQSREWRGELLYRARAGQEPPRLRTLVLVLDISPSCYGSLEITLRLTAHILAASLIKARLSAVLVTAGGASRVRALERPVDLLELWTARSLAPADAGGALRVARSLQETLRDGVLEPSVLVLSHPWFGAHETLFALSTLRGLFVQYPGQRVKPALADYCERWESIAAGDLVQLVERLARLVA